MDPIRSMYAFPEERREITTASEDFKKNLQSHNRYVDKTQILIPLLQNAHETTFFLRPRRFGKTLTLSMLRYYLEDTRDEGLNAENRKLFEGMKIMQAGAFYTSQMTSFPVISLTFQTVKGNSFEDAYEMLISQIQDIYDQYHDILRSDKLTKVNKRYFQRVWTGEDPETGKFASVTDYKKSLKNLTLFLRMVYGKRTVLLIDEYDVPLEKACQGGYSSEMADVIGGMLQSVLKTNSENLQFAVVTGCLRISGESIFERLNSHAFNTVLSYGENDVIGFTWDEVQELLEENGLAGREADVRDWYEGYHFGETVIYNPWSVIKFIENAKAGDPTEPRTHWGSTSSNDILRDLAAEGSRAVKDRVEQLMRGEIIQFDFTEYMACSEISCRDEGIFNLLLNTGYLTATSFDGKVVRAKIPNKEVKTLFEDQIKAWFDRHVRQSFDVEGLYQAIREGDADGIQAMLKNELLSAISCHDTQEVFCHEMLFSLMASNQDYEVTGNRESGASRFIMESRLRYDRDNAIVLEVAVASSLAEMEILAGETAGQMEQRKTVMDLLREGYRKIYTYGIAFFGKSCRVCAGPVCRQSDMDRLLTQKP